MIMIKKGDLYFPIEEFKKKAWLKSKAIYQEAAKNPVKFWEKLAKELSWFKKWKKAFIHKPPYFQWFIGGKINITANIFEKDWQKKKDKIALIWEPEPNNEKPRILTYQELFSLVCKFANSLKKLGVKKRDVVGIYLPMIPEVIVSMLACARIGAVHSVVFSAFSPQALRIRLQDTQAKILITADGYYRRGKLINLKESADDGIKETKIEKVIVVKRAKNEISFKKGRDLWWHDLIEKEKDDCQPAIMDSEDLLFVLYTSGCCHKDTLIQLENGEIKKISELIEKGGSNLINIDLNKLKQDVDPIINKYKYYWPFELWKIQTPLSTIKVTPNHPFFVLQEDGAIVEKQAKDLKIGEHILQIIKISPKVSKQRLPHPKIQYQEEKCNLRHHLSNKPALPEYLTPNFAQILGYLMGDGHLTDMTVVATDKDRKNLLFYKDLFEKEFKVRTRIEIFSRQNLVINSAYLTRYLKKVFPEISFPPYKKKVPRRILVSQNKCVAAFIRGFFDAEGSVTTEKIKITNQSKELIQTLQMLLLRFGIIANYFEEERKTHFGKKYHYEILVPGLIITDRKSLEDFKNKIGFSSLAKMKRLEKLLKKLEKKKIRSMIYQTPINGIARTFRKTIMLPKKETRAIHLDSYIYSNRRIKKDRLPEIRNYLQRKINLLRSLNLGWKKKLNPAIRSQIKIAIRLLKVSQKRVTEISGKTSTTVHQYLNAKKPRVSEKALNKFYKPLLPYLLSLKKEKLKILRELREKVRKLEKLQDVGFFEIKKITKEKNDSNLVYDLTTFKNHNYLANSFVAHNSTGIPKGCEHTCGGYTIQAYWTGKWIFDLHEDSIFWSTADLGWITGVTYSCFSPLLNGTRFLIYEGAPDYPTPDRWAKIIEKYKVTIFYTAPTAIRMFVKYGKDWLKNRDLSSLRILGSVGEPIDEETWQWYFREVGKGKCPIVDTWWQTETGGILITSLPGIGPFKPAFVGLPFPGLKFDILDEKGKSLPAGKEGNLVLLPPFAPGLLRGIYKNPQKYEKTYWSEYGPKIYFTSDAAFKDKLGLIRIVGRVDDVIKVAGHRLTTGELENAINKLEEVTESAVVGIPDEIKGEVPVAFVVAKKIEKDLSQKVISQVRKEIGPIASLKEVYFVKDLPKTRSGKIMRRILKRLFTGENLGDLSTLANPESVEEIKSKIKNQDH
jgi:acyl-coenzyme A synthetase/AMP-(fatty) acid ligase/intein/homing endonuclease